MDIDIFKLYIKLRYGLIYSKKKTDIKPNSEPYIKPNPEPNIKPNSESYIKPNSEQLTNTLINKIQNLQKIIDDFDIIFSDKDLVNYGIYENDLLINDTKYNILINDKELLIELDIIKLYKILQIQRIKINFLTNIGDELKDELLKTENKINDYEQNIKKLIDDNDSIKKINEQLKKENVKLLNDMNIMNPKSNIMTYNAKVNIDFDAIRKMLNKT